MTDDVQQIAWSYATKYMKETGQSPYGPEYDAFVAGFSQAIDYVKEMQKMGAKEIEKNTKDTLEKLLENLNKMKQ